EAEGLQAKRISKSGVDILLNYSWPGNVRELENLVRRLAALYPQDELSVEIIRHELSDAYGKDSAGGAVAALPEGLTLSQAVEQYLQQHFSSLGGELPPPGLYDRVLAEVEYPLILAVLAACR